MLQGRSRTAAPGGGGGPAPGYVRPPPPGPLPALLRERGTQAATRDAISLRLIDRATETVDSATYGQLFRRSAWAAEQLRRAGVARSDAVLLLMETRLEFYYSLFGAMLLGALPVAVYPPSSQQNLVPALDHLRKVARQLPARAIVCSRPLYGVADQVRARETAVPVLDQAGELEPPPQPGERAGLEEPVLLQYTSGSLSDPKAIELCTRSIHANLSAIGDAFGMRPGDVGLSWLPLYHDMGLHSVFFSLMFAMPLVVMSPLEFIRRPGAWIRAASRYGATHSPAPSFGYAYAARRVRDEELEGVDLSRWRVAMCGAEAIDAAALARFAGRFAKVGFRASAFQGAYGLAENTVAVSFSPLEQGPRLDRVDPDALAERGLAREPAAGARAAEIASVGPPVDGHQVRIVAADGREAEDGAVGEIQVRGPSRMLGYRGDPESTRQAFDGQWLRTGDLGYARGGELYVTGRVKDLIIRGGKNYYPQDLEAAAAGVEGVRPGSSAAFGVGDAASGTEHIVLVAEVKRPELISPALEEAVRQAVFEGTGLALNAVRLVAPGVVPKTTSGKLRRAECRARYLQGRLRLPPRPGVALLARLGALTALPAPLRRAWDRVRRAFRR